MNKSTRLRPPPAKRELLRDVDKAFISTVMFELGIIPIEDPNLDMRVPLKQLSPDEARVLKRKFRKLWRKYMKRMATAQVNNVARVKLIRGKFGAGKTVPSRDERRQRKRVVYEHVWNDHIAPMLAQFEDPRRGEQTVPGVVPIG